MKESNKHLSYFDFWRGIAILMVVSIHTRVFTEANYIIESINLFYRFLCNCAVPVFLALSGFFLSKKILNDGDVLTFYYKRIKNVYLPMLLWSIPLFLLGLYNGSNLLMELVKLFTGSYSIYYFIILIIQCYILLPLIKKNIKLSIIIFFLVTMISWGMICYVLPSLPLIVYAGPFLSWGVFFVLGVYLASQNRNYSIYLPLFLIVIGLFFQYFEAYNFLDIPKNVGLGQKMSAVISNIGIILLMFSMTLQKKYSSRIFLCKILEYLGKHSFGIYLIHCYCITCVSHFIDMQYWFLKCMLITASSLFFIYVTKCILPKSFCNKYLGFK